VRLFSIRIRRAAAVPALTSLVALCAAAAPPDRLPAKKDIAAAMRRANAWQLAHPVMKPMDRNWERGTWYTGVMSAWKATRDKTYLKQALDWGKLHEWQVGTERHGGNRLFCVETWTELYLLHKKDPAMIAPAIKWLATEHPLSPAGGRKRWYLEGQRAYVDALYGAAALAMLARATGKTAYLDTMQEFFDDVSGELFDRDAGLYYRDNRFIGKASPNGRKILWSRGNGWAFAGVARILEYLPRNDPRRPGYVERFRRMAAEIAKRQGADGLWRVNLDDAEALPNPESSGSGFFCFGLAWGVNHGVLDAAQYRGAIVKALVGLMASLTPEGKVMWGQQVDSQPNAAARESTHEYVTGTFLLAAGEVYRMKR
jgi:rhamnogalacturonyl hydrolase YesR